MTASPHPTTAPGDPASESEPGRTPLAMVVGPTRLAPSVLARLGEQARPITDAVFLADIRQALSHLRRVLGTDEGECLVLPGSGTAGMESLAVSLLDPHRPTLVLSTGMWGERWQALCCDLGLPTTIHRAEPGRGLDLDRVESLLASRSYQAVLVTHVDSSSGVRADIAAVTALAHRHGALGLIDGIAAAGAEIVRQDEWEIDVYLTAPPKALSGPGGLYLVSLREAAVLSLVERDRSPRGYSLDLRRWLPVMRSLAGGEFAYFQTPPGNLMGALSESLRLVVEEGPERFSRHARLADRLRRGLAGSGLELFTVDPTDRAHGVTVLRTPEGRNPAELVAAVEQRGVVIQPGTHPVAAGYTVRVGHLGNHTELDIDRTITALRTAAADR